MKKGEYLMIGFHFEGLEMIAIGFMSTNLCWDFTVLVNGDPIFCIYLLFFFYNPTLLTTLIHI